MIRVLFLAPIDFEPDFVCVFPMANTFEKDGLAVCDALLPSHDVENLIGAWDRNGNLLTEFDRDALTERLHPVVEYDEEENVISSRARNLNEISTWYGWPELRDE